MNTQQITVELPMDILLTLNEDENELKKEIRLALAIMLFRLEKITIGKAAQIADMSHLEFETKLSENQIPISNLTFEEVIRDSKKLQ